MIPFDPIVATDETAWLAVRYLLGELPADDAADFEARLGEDQAAREAVARAALLVESIGAVEVGMSRPAPVRRVTLRRASALAATIAVVVLAGLFLRNPGDGSGLNPSGPNPGEVDPARLALLWSDSAGDLNVGLDPESGDTADSGDDLLPPDWLLAAVEYESMPTEGDPSLDLESGEVQTN